jgi:hypothetical protein
VCRLFGHRAHLLCAVFVHRVHLVCQGAHSTPVGVLAIAGLRSTPTFGGRARPGRHRRSAQDFAKNHYETSGRIRGTVRIDGRHYDVELTHRGGEVCWAMPDGHVLELRAEQMDAVVAQLHNVYYIDSICGVRLPGASCCARKNDTSLSPKADDII